jgi:hypothetical protein
MLHILGHSDDVVCIEGDVNDEISPGRTITVGTSMQGMYVKLAYSPKPHNNACWRGYIQQIGEGVPMFPCEVGVTDSGYSVLFTIYCPPGTPVTVGKRVLNAKVAP